MYVYAWVSVCESLLGFRFSSSGWLRHSLERVWLTSPRSAVCLLKYNKCQLLCTVCWQPIKMKWEHLTRAGCVPPAPAMWRKMEQCFSSSCLAFVLKLIRYGIFFGGFKKLDGDVCSWSFSVVQMDTTQTTGQNIHPFQHSGPAQSRCIHNLI